MASVGVELNASKDHWKGTDCIERKLGSVLDRKVVSSTKHILLDRIEFKEASKADPFYSELKNKYTPLNSSSNKQQNGEQKEVVTNQKKRFECANNKSKDELPGPKYDLFDREKIQLRWKNVRRVGPGLYNLGNTCFLNSVIQVLTYTPPLVNYLATQEHSKTCRTVGFCMLCELQRHVLRTFGHGQSDTIKPMAIIQKLKYIAKHLRFGHQEDSHEFLRYVVDGMLKSCLAGVSEKLDTYTKGTTMVHQVFGGYYRSQVTCEMCHHTSNTYDPLMEILLDIKHAHSVLKALYKLISVELLNGENMYLCPRCKRKVPAKKHLTVHRPPNVMTMCLKRFDCHSLFGTKLNKEVSYCEHFDLRPFMSKNKGPAVMYKLFAVLVHSGYSCNSGHYYCFVKASNDNWYLMNDSTVRQVSLKTVLEQQAYLLFYIRESIATKEKPRPVQQQVRKSQSVVNGVKPWKSESSNNQQHTPKIISGPNKNTVNRGQPVPSPRKAKLSDKENVVTSGEFASSPTKLPQAREKVSFSLNQGAAQRKPAISVVDGKAREPEDADEQQETTPGTSVLSNEKGEENSKNHDAAGSVKETLEGKKTEPLSQGKLTSEEDHATTGGRPSPAESVRRKDSKETSENEKGLHATTKWKVTANDTSLDSSLMSLLPGGAPSTRRERTPSLSSDVSIASKTGDWNVSDRSAGQAVGPRLPERQHAGWKVLSAEDVSPKREKDVKGEKGRQQKDKDKEGRKEKDGAKEDVVQDPERTLKREQVDENEDEKKRRKRKHSKEKTGKSKFRKADDETRLLSDECRRSSKKDEADENHNKKSKKLKKKKKKKKKRMGKLVSSGHDSDASSDGGKHERKKKGHKKSKKKKKRRKHSQDTENCGSGKDEPSPEKRKTKNFGEKAKEVVGKIVEVSKKNDREQRRPLVAYSDRSSSEDERLTSPQRFKGSSKSGDEHSKVDEKNKVKSQNCEEISSPSGRSGVSKDRGRVVHVLLERSRGSLNYGCEVGRWDGSKEDTRVGDAEESRKRRRDTWDEEYDRGKVKRTKNKNSIRSRSYHGENLFQREHDRKRMTSNGWRYSTSSSSSRWHNRSVDRHSRRDRR